MMWNTRERIKETRDRGRSVCVLSRAGSGQKQQTEWRRQHGCLWAVIGQTHCQREQRKVEETREEMGTQTNTRNTGEENVVRVAIMITNKRECSVFLRKGLTACAWRRAHSHHRSGDLDLACLKLQIISQTESSCVQPDTRRRSPLLQLNLISFYHISYIKKAKENTLTFKFHLHPSAWFQFETIMEHILHRGENRNSFFDLEEDTWEYSLWE